MDIFLKISAIVLLIFGALLVLAPNVVKKISDFLNRKVFAVEEKMEASSKISGFILLALAGIIFYFVFKR